MPKQELLTPVLMVELSVGISSALSIYGFAFAFGKLQEILKVRSTHLSWQHWLNLLLALTMVGFGADFVLNQHLISLLAMTGIAFLLGFLLVLPIGGADMPVVVSMLNSYSGWVCFRHGFHVGQSPADYDRRAGGKQRSDPLL